MSYFTETKRKYTDLHCGSGLLAVVRWKEQ